MKKTTTGLSLTTGLSKLNSSAFSGIRKQSASAGLPNSQGINFGLPSNRKALLQPTSAGTDWAQLASKVASGGAASALSGGSGSSGTSALSKLGLGPVVSGILGLFGKGSTKALPPLQLFQLPSAMNQTAHVNSSPAPRAGSGSNNGSTVHVHVQAIDSQSFMSRSSDIAKAVKSAMLNSHSLNDVVSEL
jgi:hypothetical protein